MDSYRLPLLALLFAESLPATFAWLSGESPACPPDVLTLNANVVNKVARRARWRLRPCVLIGRCRHIATEDVSADEKRERDGK